MSRLRSISLNYIKKNEYIWIPWIFLEKTPPPKISAAPSAPRISSHISHLRDVNISGKPHYPKGALFCRLKNGRLHGCEKNYKISISFSNSRRGGKPIFFEKSNFFLNLVLGSPDTDFFLGIQYFFLNGSLACTDLNEELGQQGLMMVHPVPW